MPCDRISRTVLVDGVVTPAFIHNGSHFFVNLQVYADGLVDCWGLVDRALFADKLASGWVTTSVPDGAEISIHGLGDWLVADGQWHLDAAALERRVGELIGQLNPRLENLHDCHGREEELIDGVRVASLPTPTERPLRTSGSRVFGTRIDGARASVFVRVGEHTYLADLRAFADGVVELGRLPEPETMDVEGVRRALADGRLLAALAPGTRIEIHGLGSFTAAEEVWSADVEDVVRSVPDLVDRAAGRPDSIARCRTALATYLGAPTEGAREVLRAAYEAVPTHERQYVGDMDTKDVAVRMILYGEQELEGWSHRAVARALGEPLPTITVPRPTKG